MIFRDHLMSDLIGFVYSGMNARDAAGDFLRRIRDNCAPILAAGRDALAPIILDGENAWEYYDRNGRPFFRELYAGIVADPKMEAITVSEAFDRMKPSTLDHIFPGSWISANFDVWIGAEEDNRAWEFVLAARKAYAAATGVPEDKRRLAYEELLIAEGSDWCWWYGPEHHTANRDEFDALFRGHIANVYRALGIAAPEDLSRPILRVDVEEAQISPSGPDQRDGRRNDNFVFRVVGIGRIPGVGANRRDAREAISSKGSSVRDGWREVVREGRFQPGLAPAYGKSGGALCCARWQWRRGERVRGDVGERCRRSCCGLGPD